jgi:hypothetical protein
MCCIQATITVAVLAQSLEGESTAILPRGLSVSGTTWGLDDWAVLE